MAFLLHGPPQNNSLRNTQIVASVSPRFLHPLSTTGMSALDDSVWVNGTVCNAQQFNQSLSSRDNPNPTISCLTHGQSIGLAVGTQPLFFYCLNLSRIQLTAEASFLSLFSVIAISIYIRVSPTPPTLLSGFNQIMMLRSGTYDGTGRTFEGLNGSYSEGLLTFTWFV
jgi:hypothetical protein